MRKVSGRSHFHGGGGGGGGSRADAKFDGRSVGFVDLRQSRLSRLRQSRLSQVEITDTAPVKSGVSSTAATAYCWAVHERRLAHGHSLLQRAGAGVIKVIQCQANSCCCGACRLDCLTTLSLRISRHESRLTGEEKASAPSLRFRRKTFLYAPHLLPS